MSAPKAGGVIQATYKYNGFGEQVLRATGVTTRFVYDEGGNLLGQYDNAGNAIQQYVWMEGVPVGVLTGSGTSQVMRYVQTDQLGTPRAVVDPTQQLAVWRWDESLEAFGDTAPNTDPDGNGQQFVFDLRFPGQRYDAASGLHYNYMRDYDPATGRYTQSDPIGLVGGVSTYSYALNMPTRLFDRFGLWAGVDDAVFTIGGALAGVAGQAISDWLNGETSGWEDYVGSAVGGAVFGETLLYAGPVVAGLAGGAATNLTKQGLKNITGKQCGFNWTSLGVDTAIGGATGFIPGIRIAGITKGRGSWNWLYKKMSTQLARGQIKRVSLKTATKMFGGRAVDTAVVPGVACGAVAGAFGAPYVPGYTDSNACSCK
jgi:type VI secretion system secreted protein VgrG